MDDIALMREIAKLQEQISALRTIETGGVWSNWTITWTAATTNPAIGNGVLVGRYCAVGKMCTCYINMVAGSTTTFGSGAWEFSLPITSGVYPTANHTHIGSGFIRDASPVANYPLLPTIARSNTTIRLIKVGNESVITATIPITWAEGDQFNIQITYEI